MSPPSLGREWGKGNLGTHPDPPRASRSAGVRSQRRYTDLYLRGFYHRTFHLPGRKPLYKCNKKIRWHLFRSRKLSICVKVSALLSVAPSAFPLKGFGSANSHRTRKNSRFFIFFSFFPACLCLASKQTEGSGSGTGFAPLPFFPGGRKRSSGRVPAVAIAAGETFSRPADAALITAIAFYYIIIIIIYIFFPLPGRRGGARSLGGKELISCDYVKPEVGLGLRFYSGRFMVGSLKLFVSNSFWSLELEKFWLWPFSLCHPKV